MTSPVEVSSIAGRGARMRSGDLSAAAAEAHRASTGETPVPPVSNRIGSWDLVRLLGEGSLSCVYQARSATGLADQAAQYAVKLLRDEWQSDPRGALLLKREAQVGRAVSHAHLISILAAQVQQHPHY